MSDSEWPRRQDPPLEMNYQWKQVLEELKRQRQEFQVLREEVQGSSRSVHSEVEKLKSERDLNWKFLGHKTQFELNSDVDEKAKQAKWAIQNGKYNYAIELLDEVSTTLKERNKHIRIADTSPGGWDTVKLYLSNPIAADEDDESKINRAENTALKLKKDEQLGKVLSTRRG